MTWLPLQENRKNLTLQHKTVSRANGTLSAGLSLFERWRDDNYSPQILNYAWEETPQAHKIVARLQGFTAQDVHVDLIHETVVILLSSDHRAASVGRQEYYCEVLMPVGVKQDKVRVEIGDEWLTIFLHKKKPNVFTRIVSEVVRLGNDRQLHHLEHS